jgi:methionyl-tRNA synthetase
MGSPYYLTTAIYYANARPHIGHAYEIIAADVIARFQRLRGHTVFFLTGTDEHGVKVQKTAATHQQSPQAYVDQVVAGFEDTWSFLNITHTRFVRTTSPAHYETVQAVWRNLLAKGDIYKASYSGLYCSGCEVFLTEKELTPEGHCPIHQTTPEPVTEENYFFRLSAYRDKIRQHLEAHPDWIQPQFRRTEVLNQLEELQDISVSRSVSSVQWGIPVPDDASQVIYVWIDALSNYLTGASWPEQPDTFKTLWPPAVQIIGKDILRFHALYWPAMLMALNLPLPTTLLVHGFITVADTKISKSLGNVISVEDLVKRFELDTVDPIRYYMMTAAAMGHDGCYTEDLFKTQVNADLANNLGNLLNRVLNMLNKYCQGVVPQSSPESLSLSTPEQLQQIALAYERFAFNEAAGSIIELVNTANKFVNDQEPWALHKNEKFEQLEHCLYSVLNTLKEVAILLSPITPELSQRIWKQLGYQSTITDCVWENLETPLPVGQVTELTGPILPRLDSELAGASKKDH